MEELIIKAVKKLSAMGLHVKGLVIDQGANFLKLANNCGSSADKPYFTVDAQKVYYFFDMSHLLNSTRNNFLIYEFKIDEGIRIKKYIEDIIEAEKRKSF